MAVRDETVNRGWESNLKMSKGAFDYGVWMSKRSWEMEPIETKESIFVMWQVHGGIYFSNMLSHGGVGRKMKTLAIRSWIGG
jgi:hypothetical protein